MSITSEANTMRATFPPQSAQVSASREPTPKPSDRVVFSLAHSTTHPHVAGFSSPDWTSSDQHIYDTPSPISIARSSSEGSGQKHLPRSDVHSTDPARRGECMPRSGTTWSCAHVSLSRLSYRMDDWEHPQPSRMLSKVLEASIGAICSSLIALVRSSAGLVWAASIWTCLIRLCTRGACGV